MAFAEILEFGNANQRKWSELSNANKISSEQRKDIEDHFDKESLPLFSSDIDLIVYGSLARNECTSRSDLDWALLVDGQINPSHHDIYLNIRARLEHLDLQKPGATGLFGQIVYAHDLVNYIGGEDDSNHNLSRRILLLLESDKLAVGAATGAGSAYDRVIRGIINQYISHDSGFSSDRGLKAKVPRFLLNDIVRFWRTMCVDFAFKQREQEGQKWALRNIKLRMSRKLIFVKGLLMCFSCYNKEVSIEEIKEMLYRSVLMPPLEFLYQIFQDYNMPNKQLIEIYDSYDKFLGILNRKESREHLEGLEMHKVYDDNHFIEARRICDNFQQALDNIFLYERSSLSNFIFKYGVF